MLENFTEIIRTGFDKYGAVIFTGATVVGIGALGVTSYRAGKYVGEHPEAEMEEKAKVIAGPVAIGVAAAGAAIASQYKNSTMLATMASTTLMNEQKREDFVKKTKEFVGEENFNKMVSTMKPSEKHQHRYTKEELDAFALNDQYMLMDDYTGAVQFIDVDTMYQNLDKAKTQFVLQGNQMTLRTFLDIMGFGYNDPIYFNEYDEEINCRDIGWPKSLNLQYLPAQIIKTFNKDSGNATYFIDFEDGAYPVAMYR